MPDYRLYFFDRTGHIGGVVELACADDFEAALKAQAHGDGRLMELWNRERQVRSFPADEADDPAGVPANDLGGGPRGVDPRP